uniref:Uncharacterized protein n=1 Tax=Physcomitrium patens TaxID=3218 RepID=A0A2K1IC28_PHYPA|nr:hypothetical protein PHYPA_030324 [Physcomitrium patens]
MKTKKINRQKRKIETVTPSIESRDHKIFGEDVALITCVHCRTSAIKLESNSYSSWLISFVTAEKNNVISDIQMKPQNQALKSAVPTPCDRTHPGGPKSNRVGKPFGEDDELMATLQQASSSTSMMEVSKWHLMEQTLSLESPQFLSSEALAICRNSLSTRYHVSSHSGASV